MVTVYLPDYVAGDTWNPPTAGNDQGGLEIGPVLIDEAQPLAELARIRLYFRDPRTNQLGYGFDSDVVAGLGAFEIVDAALWVARIEPLVLPLAPGFWEWDCEFTDADGVILTPYGGVLKIVKDITHG